MHFATLLSVPVLLSWLPNFDQLVGPTSNLIISRLAGRGERRYLHGARLLAHYPVSQVGHGMALNIQRLAGHLASFMEELESTFVRGVAARVRRKPERVSGHVTSR